MPDQRRRVLFVDHTAVLGGGELALLALLRELDRSLFDPVVLLLSDGPLIQELEGLAETHVLALPDEILKARRDDLSSPGFLWTKLVIALRYLHSFSRLVRKLRPRLIHSNSLKADVLTGIVAAYSRIPQIWHIRDRISEDYLPSSVVALFRIACQLLPNALIANSRSTLESLHLGSETVGVVISSGIDLKPFVDSKKREHFTLEQSSAANPIQIGIIGRICAWKGQDVFLRSAGIVHEFFPNAHYHIVGGPLFEELEFEKQLHDMAATLGLSRQVTFAGFRRDIPDYVSGLDIVVHASTIPEPFGQVIVQGMAAGKPVIATEGGGPSEIVEDGVTGFLVPRNNATALAGAIMHILNNPKAAQIVAERGQKEALQRYGSEITTRKVEELYKELLAG
ncbi:glycosyltransferase family 4 protein [Granulicella sibirica]|uniref:Glycosyltransferase n=1 Tax=Granulicella sibirica TaxID=2479048 RepID=A0A4Q0T6V5_9BACT|nr:glycosyltransferase family 4 protein [Granulicella sibirica]RXH58400.1 Glycosyltransferase [Granulicella sibirica]